MNKDETKSFLFLYKERTQSKILSFEDISTCAKDEQ